MTKEGHCACGTTHFEVAGEPLGTGACHCTSCQKLSGGGPNYVVLMPKGTLKVLQGEPKLYTGTGDSGGTVSRAFCPDCGTPLWSIPENAPFFTVKVGAFDDPAELAPAMHVYTSSAPAWHPIAQDRPNFPKMPPMEAPPI